MPYRAACILKINDNTVDRIELSKSENAYEEGGNKQVNNKTASLDETSLGRLDRVF